MATPVGITVPKMLPITGTWALPFAAYFITLSTRVVAKRVQNECWIEEKTNKATEGGADELHLAIRAHSNYAENVPIALMLASIVELNGGNRKVLSGSLAALLLVRILHVELGLKGTGRMSNGRPIGYFGTLGFIGGMAGYAAYLVKGYWGF